CAAPLSLHISFFFFPAPPPTDIYTLSLHDALPILLLLVIAYRHLPIPFCLSWLLPAVPPLRSGAKIGTNYLHFQEIDQSIFSKTDRKSTRLNSSHVKISYAVFCLKKKNRTLETKK